MAHGQFFAVGRDTFAAACNLGITPAAVFLVLARGSGGDNVTTRWSAAAGSTRLGIRWTTAKAAIAELTKAKLIKIEKGSTRPSYTLTKKGDLIWLPNALIDGAGDEVPPVTKLRQTQDVMALRLLVELYAQQNLREDGGISPTVIWAAYKRERTGQHGAYVVWRFHGASQWVSWDNDVTPPHRKELSKQELQDGKSSGADVFRRLGLLTSLGLVEWVPYLFEGPEGEPIHPLHWSSALAEELALYEACATAAVRCLTEGQYEIAAEEGGVLAPVLAHIEQVQLIGIARLHYRPHTTLTAAWWADHRARCQGFIERYAEIAAPAVLGDSACEVA